jgi:hypothetical protein
MSARGIAVPSAPLASVQQRPSRPTYFPRIPVLSLVNENFAAEDDSALIRERNGNWGVKTWTLLQ